MQRMLSAHPSSLQESRAGSSCISCSSLTAEVVFEVFGLHTGDVTFLEVTWLGLVWAPQRGLRRRGAQNAGELFQYPNGGVQSVAQLYTNNA